MTQVETMAVNLLIFLRNRERDGKSWSRPTIRSQHPGHVQNLHRAVLRCLRMGTAQESGGYIAITAAGIWRLEGRRRGHG